MLLGSQNVSNVASVDFNSLISGSYNTYELAFNSVECPLASTDAYLIIQISDDGGVTFKNMNYINYLGGSAANGISCGLLYDGGGMLAFKTSGSTQLFNLRPGISFISSVGQATFFESTIPYAGGQSHYGMYNGTPVVIDSLRVASSDGNPVSGNFYLYGY